MRLGFFDEVNVETPAVPGTSDQVDVNYSVVERPSGNLMLGLGFSQTQGVIINANITQDNFLGSGKRVKFAFNNSDVNTTYAMGYTDPYWSVHGVSLGYDASYQETNAANANVIAYNSSRAKAGINLGIPVSEFQFFNLGAHYERHSLGLRGFSFPAAQGLINDINGVSGNCWVDNPADNDDEPPSGVGFCPDETDFDVLRFDTSFAYDTRNKAILPDRGMLHRVRAEVAAPPGDIQIYKVNYDGSWFYPLSDMFTLALQAEVGYGASYGGATKELPFFENFYAGGPRSVRGYMENTLGIKDFNARATGGRLRTIGNAEILFPVPFATEAKSVRLSAFFDAGNVFGPGCRKWSTLDSDRDPTTNQPKCLDEVGGGFDVDDLRLSTGLSGIWMSPFGVLSVSVAYPINAKDDCNKQPNPNERNSDCDKTQFFQFTFGTSF
jgi:outer membrane protein insertion porin family